MPFDSNFPAKTLVPISYMLQNSFHPLVDEYVSTAPTGTNNTQASFSIPLNTELSIVKRFSAGISDVTVVSPSQYWNA